MFSNIDSRINEDTINETLSNLRLLSGAANLNESTDGAAAADRRQHEQIRDARKASEGNYTGGRKVQGETAATLIKVMRCK